MRILRLGRFASKGFATVRLLSRYRPGAMLAELGQSALVIALAVIAIGIPQAGLARSGGAPDASSGGSLPGEQLCTRCHQGTANSGSGRIELLVNGAQPTEYAYTPGETVPILIRAADDSAARIGFQVTTRVGNGCTQGGTLIAGTSMRARSAQGTGDCSGTPGELQWVTHSRPQSGASAEFRLDWTAPGADSGPVTFALAVVAANGDGSANGDQVYSFSAKLEEQAVAPLGPPQISQENGVVLGDYHTMTGRGAPGALATVRGTDFVAEDDEQWLGFDPEEYPSVLGGACVEVNADKVPLKSVAPDRIDFQIPVTATVGRVTVQVFRDCGEPTEAGSNTAMFEIVATQPAFLWFAASPPAIAGRHKSDEMPIGPKGLLPGVDTSPAIPGEEVSLYGTGFGEVTPALATGEVAREDRALGSSNYEVSIDGTALPVTDVVYIGAAPGFLGVNRLDVRLPTDIAAGLHEISLKVNGVATPSGPALIVANPPEQVQAASCTAGPALAPGQTCWVRALDTRIGFNVEADGSKLCASVPLRNQKSCGATNLELPQYGYRATKNENGTWTITEIN